MLEKKSVVKGFFWTAIETYSGQGIAFLVSIVMARLLMPNDYGIIGMITVFMCIADTLIDAGFTQALIRKQDCTAKDYSTVFYFNITISCAIFALLFCSAPFIAKFYETPLLKDVTRIMGLSFVISSIGAVSSTILVKEFRFKQKAIISLVCSIFSGVIGIYLAYNGLGVYALVLQTVLAATLRMLITLIMVRWFPSLCFSIDSFKKMFGFGVKILASNLIFTIYQNIYNIVIGKFFSATNLGYYTRADGYSKLIPTNINGVLMKVLYPLLAKIQNNDEELVKFNKKLIQLTSFLIFPATLFLAGAAYPIISIMISDKWLPTAPLLQILCIAVMFDHISTINWDFILTKGRSDIILRQQWYTKGASLAILLVTLFWGLNAVAIGKGFSSLIFLASSIISIKKVLPVSIREIFSSVGGMGIIALTLSTIVYMAFLYLEYSIMNVLLMATGYFLIYMVIGRIKYNEVLSIIIQMIKRKY